MRNIFVLLITLMLSPAIKADEGMWLPFLISDQQIEMMQQKGLEIPFESIYSHSAPSLKDAVVSLDDGACTGEFISNKGLLITNHHCGYNEIQQHSTLEHNYLEDGFWAKTLEQELPNPGKTATLLIEAHDVTQRIHEAAQNLMGAERQHVIDSICEIVEVEAFEKSKLEATVKSFFYGNTYILFLTETYADVRLVGTPPSSIGKFGGDTDNWMWPRHTGDFSFFRVYCAPDGSPAEYSPENIPFTPKMHFKINSQGYNKGDFTMTMGYPGYTQRYLTSHGVQEIQDVINPVVAEVRGIKQTIWADAMESSPIINIKYAAKYSESSNYWKYAIGQNQALEKLSVIEQREQTEASFNNWIQKDSVLLNQYGKTLSIIEASYMLGNKLTLAETITDETMLQGAELVNFALETSSLFMELMETDEAASLTSVKDELTNTIQSLYKDYDAALDQQVFEAMLQFYLEEVPENLRPPVEELVGKKYVDDLSGFVKSLYKQTAFTSADEVMALFSNPDEEALFADPAIVFSYQVLSYLYQMMDIHDKLLLQFDDSQRQLIKGYMEQDKGKTFYPDANSTMRLSYGSVGDYEPKDGVKFKYLTTLSGIIEKENQELADFQVPEQLKIIFKNKDYGPYQLADGQMPVCFLTSNDITGGNSGSPVLNGKGQLIGVAFDGNWEAMTSDLAYESRLQKCICVDIRYVLLVVDKLAGAHNLIEEMDIVTE
ncbi:S46 family peptidase [Carboxylicivirga sediminis]|uniref:Dipeptidyl-peptidase n=1 Tax=Carboxylicivirga sediminis TaxID=2006564 RepID=A0A941IUS2_9BACT|nr:S46 family peptidase [Carboxylicivirga sediminis]MBR8534375.1 S46 family peptidase [Carboxylicivirga sediminis]